MSTLLVATLKLYHNRPRTVTVERIASDTGLHPQWIHRFAADKAVDPGVAKVQQLYEYLSGRKLDV